MPRSPQWMDLYQIWFRVSSRGRNQLCGNLLQSAHGFRFCEGSKFAISHRLGRSPLIQCWRYRAACDVYCVQHWLCTSYSPASNPLWGGVLFPCKRVAAFPFVTHLNTWPFERTRARLTSKHSTHVRIGPRLSKLSHCNDCNWATYDWNYGGLTIRKWNCLSWYTAGNSRDTLQYSGWNTIIQCLNWSQFKQFLLKLQKCGKNNMNQNCSQNSVSWT